MPKILRTMTLTEYYDGEDNNLGLCTACSEESDQCEPDAEGYLCSACGKRTVQGLMNLVERGYIKLVDEEDNEGFGLAY